MKIYHNGYTWMKKRENRGLNNLKKIGESMNVSKRTVKIWKKNYEKGYLFFQPHNAHNPTPRTLKEAYGYNTYQQIKESEFNNKETTKAYVATIFIVLLAIGISFVHADDYWESSPYNWENSINNWDNTEHNWDNSPNNWKNSTNNYDSDTVVRDNNGKATGYSVPKQGGGYNHYDLDGNRTGYTK
jgi:hypothetical protein